MNRFAALLDRLAYEPRRNAKIRLLEDYFRRTPDPERGYALAAMTGSLSFREAKPNLIRALIQERTDPILFEMSYAYVGDLAETVALLWPDSPSPREAVGREFVEAGSSPSPREAAGRVGVGGAGAGRGGGGEAGRIERGSDPAHPVEPPPTPALPHSPSGGSDFVEAGSSPSPREAAGRVGVGGAGAGRGGEGEAGRVERGFDPAHPVEPPPTPALPTASGGRGNSPALSHVVETLAATSKLDLPRHIADWLDALDETGRWALLKLITGALRIGVSARLAKTAVAGLGGIAPDAVEEVWHGLTPPYLDLFAWVEGRGPAPESRDPAPFRPPMLAHPLEDEDFAKLAAEDFTAEWKWDGIRVQVVSGARSGGGRTVRLYSRTGEDVSGAFPDLTDALPVDAALDGELLIVRDGRVQSFNVLQQRLNRKSVTGKLVAEYPAHVRAYDLLTENGEDLRALPFTERRRRLEALVARLGDPRVDLSPLVTFATWDDLAAARADPAAVGAGSDAEAIEGVMVKRADSPYVPGRPKGLWFKWKREPYLVDAVMMYAQRGHGKRSSFYSDFTFGVWREGASGEELVPVGKAYFGFTDEELAQLDRYVRNNTVKRFGPVREVAYGRDGGLVLEVAFEGLQRSTRHKSGVAMRFPRISRIRWDKSAAEADRLETLERILQRGVRELHPLRPVGEEP